MSLSTITNMFTLSAAKDWAVVHFNTHNAEMMKAAIKAAEAEKAPVILAIGATSIQHIGLRPLAAMMKAMAEEASVPVALHYDHAKDLSLIRQSLDAGFTSVMFDGSSLSYEDNVKNTIEMVKMARDCGANAEGEIGIVPHGDAAIGKTVPTDPAQAIEFAKRTGVDLLAVSVGSVHNMRSQNASLDVNLIRTIHEATGVPLVLHGGSGVMDKDIAAAVTCGLRKVNINTALKMALVDGIAEGLREDPQMDLLPLMQKGIARGTAFAVERLRLCKSPGKAA